jgi:superfamily II DNA or RNA helicase
MKIQISNQVSRIITDNPEILEVLTKNYSFSVPGAYFSKKVKKGWWNGKIKFVNKRGQFRTGLLDLILTDLHEIGCHPKLIFNDAEDLNLKEWDLDNFNYYSFQREAISYILKNKRTVIKSPTGSGKTLMIAGAIKALSNYKGVVLFNSKQILKQTYEFLKKSSINNVGVAFSEGFDLQDIMLTTPKSVGKILDTHLEEARFILVDEAHEFANGELSLNCIKSFPNASYRVGFTATPPTLSIPRLNLIGALGPIYDVVSTKDLVTDDKLTKPLIQVFQVKYPTAIKNIADNIPYRSVYLNYIVHNGFRNGLIRNIIDKIKTKVNKAKILILVKDLEHIDELKRFFPEAITIEGIDDLTTRYAKIAKFKRDDFSIIIGTRVLQTGVNIEEISHMINARGLKSKLATIQALGRALRKHESKLLVYFYDIIDDLKYLGSHGISRLRAYKKEGHEVKEIKVNYEDPGRDEKHDRETDLPRD